MEVVWHIYRPIMSRLLEAAAPQPAEEGELEEGEEGAVAAGPAGDTLPREEPRVGDKTWASVLSDLPGCVGASSALWSVVTPELYTTFWSLQLQDIYVPIKKCASGNTQGTLRGCDSLPLLHLSPSHQDLGIVFVAAESSRGRPSGPSPSHTAACRR